MHQFVKELLNNKPTELELFREKNVLLYPNPVVDFIYLTADDIVPKKGAAKKCSGQSEKYKSLNQIVMNNYGFEIGLNGKKLIRAGLDCRHYVLSCILNSLRRDKDESEELNIDVSGWDIKADQHVNWLREDLKLGDTLFIKVIDDNFDNPVASTERVSEEEIRKRKIEHYYHLKEELKEYLDEK